MTKYKSFDTTKRKLLTTYEQIQSNRTEIQNNIIKHEIRYNSLNHFKVFNIVSVLSNYKITFGEQIEIDLIGFPDWAVNMAHPSIVFNLPDVAQPQTSYNTVAEVTAARTAGTLQVGDTLLNRLNSVQYWLVKQDNKYIFTVRFQVNAVLITAFSLTSTTFTALPVYATFNLYLVNERSYHELQSGKS